MPPEPQFQVGYWYQLHGHDWQLQKPRTLGEFTDEFRQEAAFGSMPDDTPIYEVVLDIEYGAIEENATEAGTLSIFAYLIRQALRNAAQHYGTQHQVPVPTVVVNVAKSHTEIRLLGTHTRAIQALARELDQIMAEPRRIYHDGQPTMGGQAAMIAHGTQVMRDAALHRDEVYTGVLWHNDMTLRTGLNGGALAPLDITYEPSRLFPAMTRLANMLHPCKGSARHAFAANTPELMGCAFTQRPRPMSAEAFLEDATAPHLAYNHGGSLETDDSSALLSVSYPFTLPAVMATDLLANIAAQIIHEVAGQRAELQADPYIVGDEVVISLGVGGNWSMADARKTLRLLLGLPTPDVDAPALPIDHVDVLPDERIEAFIEQYRAPEYLERLMYMRRIERTHIDAQVLREMLSDGLKRLHVPSVLAVDEVAQLFEPLVPEQLVMAFYGSGENAALLPALDADDLARSYFEPTGEHFFKRNPRRDSLTAYLAPHRLSVSDAAVVAEWYEDYRPASALMRRISLQWEQVRAWVNIGEAVALMDVAGRVIFIVPTIFDRVGPLYELLRVHEERARSRGVLFRRGGEKYLREYVRAFVRRHEQGGLAAGVKLGVVRAQKAQPSNLRAVHKPAAVKKSRGKAVTSGLFFWSLAVVASILIPRLLNYLLS